MAEGAGDRRPRHPRARRQPARRDACESCCSSGRFAAHGPETEALAFALARADHLAVTIRPALQAGTWVICDRFMDSTRAYQGAAGADAALLDLLDAIVVGSDRPDLTLDPRCAGRCRPEAHAEAGSTAPTASSAMRSSMHEARRQAFLEIAARDPKRCVVIDATAEKIAVAKAIRKAVAERLLSRAGKRG